MKVLSLKRLKHIKLVDLLIPKIVRFKYTAILDDKVCDYCRNRDGMVINSTDPEYNLYMPPAHPHCRCHWVNITSDAEEIPERNWIDPPSSFSKYFPFLFLIPFIGRKKEPVEVIEEFDIPEPKVNIEEILVINNIENSKEKVKDYLVNNSILIVFVGSRGETVLETEFSIDDSMDFTIREEKLIRSKAKSYVMDNSFEAANEWEYEIKKKFNLRNKF